MPGTAVGVDHAALAREQVVTTMDHLALLRTSPAAAAAYGLARARGVREDDAQQIARDTAIVVGITAAASTVAAVKAVQRPRPGTTSAPAPNQPARSETVGQVRSAVVEPTTSGGSIRNINKGLPLGKTPGTRDLNCAKCAVATDAMLAGSKARAFPGRPTYGAELCEFYGKTWSRPTAIGEIETQMRSAGPGGRGIVFGERPHGEMGHYFNVANQDGAVRFLDGQVGAPANVNDGYVRFWLLRTN